MAHLDVAAGTRSSELARRLGVTRQAVHQTIRELRDLGLVELSPDPGNASAKLVTLTERGRENVAAARAAFAEVEAELARRIGARHVQAL